MGVQAITDMVEWLVAGGIGIITPMVVMRTAAIIVGQTGQPGLGVEGAGGAARAQSLISSGWFCPA